FEFPLPHCFDYAYPQHPRGIDSLPANLRTRRERLRARSLGHLAAQLHHAVAVAAVRLPLALEAIAVRPEIRPGALAPVGHVVADVALPGPGRAGAPGVHAPPVLAVLH